MHVWLYDTLISDQDLWPYFGGEVGIVDRVVPRRSEEGISNLELPKPFLVIGLGNDTNEHLGDDGVDFQAHRQFFQVWIHDEGGSYDTINNIIPIVKRRLVGKSDGPSDLTTVVWLETSQEFSNETYNTLFRYIRFQGIISRGAAA